MKSILILGTLPLLAFLSTAPLSPPEPHQPPPRKQQMLEVIGEGRGEHRYFSRAGPRPKRDRID